MRRESTLGNAISTAVLIGLALLTIIGLLAEDSESIPALFSAFLLQTVAIVAAFAVFIGVMNLMVSVHLRRLLRFGRGWFYSLITVLSGLVVVIVYGLDRTDAWEGDLKGEELTPELFNVVQISLESALAGLVLFFLVFAAYRLLRNRVSIANVLFVASLLVVLVGWLPLDPDNMEMLTEFRQWLLDIPVTSGARGLLIGIGLGTLTVGVRLLIAQERVNRPVK